MYAAVTAPAIAAIARGVRGTRRKSGGAPSASADGSRVESNWSQWDAMDKVRGNPPDHNPRGNGFFDRYEEDLDRSAALGADAFSYAIDWSRLEPEEGKFDEAEIARVVAIVK